MLIYSQIHFTCDDFKLCLLYLHKDCIRHSCGVMMRRWEVRKAATSQTLDNHKPNSHTFLKRKIIIRNTRKRITSVNECQWCMCLCPTYVIANGKTIGAKIFWRYWWKLSETNLSQSMRCTTSKRRPWFFLGKDLNVLVQTCSFLCP
jgi:hypothetical protein